jgi:hypothetical protein
MFHFEWDAVRAYASLVILTVVALYGIWKDEKDYKERASEETRKGLRQLLKGRAVTILYGLTLLTAAFGAVDIHATRKQAAKDKSDSQKEKEVSDREIHTLEGAVNTSNNLLTQQRQDFLQQFSALSSRLGDLQTQVKTADLQKQVEQLDGEIAAERKTIEGQKAKLSFTLLDANGSEVRSVMLRRQDGSVHVRFTVRNDTDVTAQEGVIVLIVCDKCEIVGNPAGFTKVSGSEDTRRNMDFEHVFAHSRLPPMEADVKPAPGESVVVLGIEYRCRNCENYTYVLQNLTSKRTTLPDELKGTVYVVGRY